MIRSGFPGFVLRLPLLRTVHPLVEALFVFQRKRPFSQLVGGAGQRFAISEDNHFSTKQFAYGHFGFPQSMSLTRSLDLVLDVSALANQVFREGPPAQARQDVNPLKGIPIGRKWSEPPAQET